MRCGTELVQEIQLTDWSTAAKQCKPVYKPVLQSSVFQPTVCVPLGVREHIAGGTWKN